MSLIDYKWIAALLIFLTSVVAVLYPIKVRAYPKHNHLLELGDAFASGIFLGAALFHLLPDAIKGFQTQLPTIHYPLSELCCAAGFLTLLFLERLGNYAKSALTIPYILTFIFIVHSLIEGTVLGINSTFAEAAVIFLAIIAHKGSESFALAVILNRSKLPSFHMIGLISLFSVMTPIGIVCGAASLHDSHLIHESLFSAGFNAFAAGTFLYMSTLHHINHHHEDTSESFVEFIVLVLGLALMAGLVLLT